MHRQEPSEIQSMDFSCGRSRRSLLQSIPLAPAPAMQPSTLPTAPAPAELFQAPSPLDGPPTQAPVPGAAVSTPASTPVPSAALPTPTIALLPHICVPTSFVRSLLSLGSSLLVSVPCLSLCARSSRWSCSFFFILC